MNVNELHKTRKIKLYYCKICSCEMQCISRKFYCDDCRNVARHQREKECREHKNQKNTANENNLISCITSAEKNKMSYGQYMAARRAGKIIE